MPGTSWSPIWRTTHRRRRPGPTRPARPVRAPPRPSASCDAPPRKGARRAPLAPARRRGPEGGRRSPDTARLCAADRVQAHSCGSASHRRTRGDVAGRRGRTRARARPDRASRPGRRAPSAHANGCANRYSASVSLRTGNCPASVSRTMALTFRRSLSAAPIRESRGCWSPGPRGMSLPAPRTRPRRRRRARSAFRPHRSNFDHLDAASREARRPFAAGRDTCAIAPPARRRSLRHRCEHHAPVE